MNRIKLQRNNKQNRDKQSSRCRVQNTGYEYLMMLNELSENFNKKIGNIKTELENIKKKQSEMKNTLVEMKNT